MILAIQCFEGDGFDVEGDWIAKQEARREAVDDQWSIIDYLDDFNHTIEAHQWHVPTRALAFNLAQAYEQRQKLVAKYRVCLEQFYSTVKGGVLISQPNVQEIMRLLSTISAENAPESFKTATNVAYNVLNRWCDELVEIGAYDPYAR